MYTSPQGGNNELAYDRKKIYSFTFLIPTLSSDCFLSLLSEFQVPYLIHHWGAELSEFFFFFSFSFNFFPVRTLWVCICGAAAEKTQGSVRSEAG